MRRFFIVYLAYSAACTPFPSGPESQPVSDAAVPDAGGGLDAGFAAAPPECLATPQPPEDAGACPKPVAGAPALLLKMTPLPGEALFAVTSKYAYVISKLESFRFPRALISNVNDGSVLPECAKEPLPTRTSTRENIALLNGALCVAGASGIDCYLDARDVGAPVRVAPKLAAGIRAFGISGMGDRLAIAVGASADTTPSDALVGPPEGPFTTPAGAFTPWTTGGNYWRYFDGGLVTVGAERGQNRTARQLDAKGWAREVVIDDRASSPAFDDLLLIQVSPSRLAGRRAKVVLTADTTNFENLADLPDIQASAFALFDGEPRVALRRKVVPPNAFDRIYRMEAVASDNATQFDLRARLAWLRWTVDRQLGILGTRDCADDTHLFATIVNF